jgi:ureidoglycolate dehydrogenase (NAD+)
MDTHVRVQPLTEFCVEVLRKAGLDQTDAQTTANVLVMTDTWGTFSHGTGGLFNYVRAIRAGGINPKAKPEIIAGNDSWAIIDAHRGMGMPACCMAMNLAIEMARTNTLAWVGVKNSSHFGAAGYYANLAAEKKMIGIAMSAADPNMVIPGARGHVIGNNPLAYAVPAGSEPPILLDIALSASAFGKIMGMKKLGQDVPANWVTDAQGTMTTSLANWPETGSLMPMAGHKGYGLAILIEVLAGLLPGGSTLSQMKSWVNAPEEPAGLGQAFLAINVESILHFGGFTERVQEMTQELRHAPKALGCARTYVPGEIEWEKRAAALQTGIPLPAAVMASLQSAGEACGVETSLLHS